VIVGRDVRQVVCLEVFADAGGTSSRPGLVDLLRQLAPHLSRAWRLDRTSWPTLARLGVAAPLHAATDATRAHEFARLPEVARLRAQFGLTKAEARLALRLAEGVSLTNAAHAFNVKLTTIRSQLQQVFAKTGTARQTELVALLLSCGHGSRRSPRSSCGSHAGEVAVAG
jgi:DNA-binding CsgD family transcriptional regulator